MLSLVSYWRKIAIQTIMRDHYTPTRMTSMKNILFVEDLEQLKLWYVVEEKIIYILESRSNRFVKNVNKLLSYSLLNIYSREKSYVYTNTCTQVFMEAFSNCNKTEKSKSIGKYIGKQIEATAHNSALLSNKKYQAIDAYNIISLIIIMYWVQKSNDIETNL